MNWAPPVAPEDKNLADFQHIFMGTRQKLPACARERANVPIIDVTKGFVSP